MLKTVVTFSALLTAASAFAASQPTVRVEPSNLQGARQLQEQTQKAAIQNYLESWQTLSAAFENNRADLIDRDFVGPAKEKLTSTIQQQEAIGIRTRYHDRSHDLKIVFYSPEGLSIELADDVDYDVQVIAKDRSAPVQRVHARYIVILTPAELRWRVRVLQSQQAE